MNALPIEPANVIRRSTRALPENARRSLRGKPRQVLEQLAAGDPLAVAERVSAYLARERLLMDEHRVYLRSLAFVARASQRYRGRPGLARWLDQQVACAVASLRAETNTGSPGERWSGLAAGFGLGTRELDHACARFHELPFEARAAFFALVLEGKPIESLVYPGSRPTLEIIRDARRALAIFMELALQPTSQEECS